MFSGAHLSYEIAMCHQTATNIRFGNVAEGVLKNALVESYALHLRNLIEFLYWKTSKNRDGLSASDFVRSREAWLKGRGRIPKVLTVAHDRANKQVLHFTKKRFASGAPETHWLPGVELAALANGLRTFVDHADPEKLHPQVGAVVELLAAAAPEEG